jgi:queuine tRNA-ribosyltransferase
MLGLYLLSYHNVAFYLNLMAKIREAIQSGNFSQFKRDFLVEYRQHSDQEEK